MQYFIIQNPSENLIVGYTYNNDTKEWEDGLTDSLNYAKIFPTFQEAQKLYFYVNMANKGFIISPVKVSIDHI